MKYYVIAEKWDSEKACTSAYVAGDFDNLVNAMIFQDAYGHYYNCKPKILTHIDDDDDDAE